MPRTTKATTTAPRKTTKKVVEEKPKKVIKKTQKKVEELSSDNFAEESSEEEIKELTPKQLRKEAMKSTLVDSDAECAEKLLDLEGRGKFKYCGGIQYVFDERKGMFVNQKEVDDTTIYYYLYKNRKYLNIEVHSNGKLLRIDNYGNDKAFLSKIIPFLKIMTLDDDWIYNTQHTSLYFLLFKDGIYDMANGTFKKGFDDNIVFHCQIPHNFPEYNEKELDYAMEKSFDVLFNEPDQMLVSLAVALTGDPLKKFYFCPGKTNAGKSYLVKMLRIVFGNYIGMFNAEVFANVKSGSQDEAQKNRWSLLVRWCRILCSNEVDMETDLNGNKIKQKSSGADEQVARKHYQSEISFTPHYTCFCMLNDIPKITFLDKATEKRLVYIEFPNQFVEKVKKDYHREINEDLKRIIKTPKFINGFIWAILKAYKMYLAEGLPKYDNELKKQWIDGQKQKNIVEEVILSTYVIMKELTKDELKKMDEDDQKEYKKYYNNEGKLTDNGKKFRVSIADIKKFKEQNNKKLGNISLKNFKEQLIELGLKESSDGKTRYWEGIYKKDIFDDLD